MFKSWKKYIVGCILLISACTVTDDKDKEDGVSNDAFIKNATGDRTVAESGKGTVEELFLDAKTGNLKYRTGGEIKYYFIKGKNVLHAVYAPTEAKNTFLGISLRMVLGEVRESLIVYKDNKTDFWSEEGSVAFTEDHEIPVFKYEDFVKNATGDRTLEAADVTVNEITGDIHTRGGTEVLYSYLGRISDKTAAYQVPDKTEYVGIALTDKDTTREFNKKLELYKKDGKTAWDDQDDIYFSEFERVGGNAEFAKDWKEITDANKSSFAVAQFPETSDDNGTILLIDGSTMYKSLDRGRTWDYNVSATGLPASVADSKAVVIPMDVGNDRIVLVHNAQVYTSDDYGANWTTTATLTGNTRSSVLVYLNGSVFALGGTDAGGANGKVWKSTDDGETFTAITTTGTGIPGHSDAGAVVLGNKMYFMGGWSGTEPNNGGFLNRVYSSTDGTEWVLVNPDGGDGSETATQWQARERFVLLATDKKMYIMGGGVDGAHESDVWSSDDGVTWDKETDKAWDKRQNFGGVWYKGAGTITVNGDTITTPVNEMIIFGGQDQSGSFHTYGK